MTDPQLPPPPGAVPPVPPALSGAVPPPPVAPPYPMLPSGPAYPVPPAASAPTGYAAPPGAYQVPVGGYAQQAGGYAVPDTAPRKSALLGVLALLLSLVGSVVTTIVVGIASYEIGRRIPEAAMRVDDFDSLAWLSPARGQVLWAELSFWTGTILGIAAIVIGILAIVRKQGRGQGIAALIISVLGPVIFFLVALVALSLGGAAGAAALYS